MITFKFDAQILQSDEVGAGAFIMFPFDTVSCFGKKNQIKVRCTFDGIEYRGSIVNMGAGPCIGILKSIREKLNKQRGDMIYVELYEDKEERIIEIPKELEDAFKLNENAKKFYETLSYTNKKQYADYITSAKKQETKDARLIVVIDKLENGVKKLK